MVTSGLVRAVSGLFAGKRYEVQRDSYLSGKLREPDREPLIEVVDFLSAGLCERGLDSAILAVGSSTYSEEQWQSVARFNQGSQLKRPLQYRDIDLRIVPERITPVTDLRDALGKILSAHGYEWKAHDGTAMGTGFLSYVTIDYGLRSITTTLRSGTKLDLIMDYEDNKNPLTAQKKIAEERSKNWPFSLLYQPKSMQ